MKTPRLFAQKRVLSAAGTILPRMFTSVSCPYWPILTVLFPGSTVQGRLEAPFPSTRNVLRVIALHIPFVSVRLGSGLHGFIPSPVRVRAVVVPCHGVNRFGASCLSYRSQPIARPGRKGPIPCAIDKLQNGPSTFRFRPRAQQRRGCWREFLIEIPPAVGAPCFHNTFLSRRNGVEH